MQIRLLIAGLLLGLVACGPRTQELGQVTDLEPCEAALVAAWQRDSLAVHHDSVLERLLPRKLSGWEVESRRGATYLGVQRGFAETARVFTRPLGSRLNVQLRDYGRDTAALRAVWQEYRVAGRQESPHPFAVKVRQLGGCADAFAWSWRDRRNDFAQLEAVLYGRYHLTLATDDASASVVLQTAWDAMPWGKWQVLGMEPLAFELVVNV